MNWKRRKAKEEARAEETETEDREAEGHEERIKAEPLTEEEVQKRMAELFRITDVQGRYSLNETGMEFVNAQLHLIDDYIKLAQIKADIAEAQIYLRIEELRQF